MPFLDRNESHDGRALARLLRALALRRGVVGGDRAPKAPASVSPAAVNQERMEEEQVTALHWEVDPALQVGVLEREESPIDVRPFGVAMNSQAVAMTSRDHG